MPDKDLIPFDLEAAKRGEPIIQRNGNPAKFIAHVPEANRVVWLDEDNDVTVAFETGHLLVYGHESPKDLCMAPKLPRKVWVNVYPPDKWKESTDMYPRKEIALMRAGKACIACIEIDWPADAPWPWGDE